MNDVDKEDAEISNRCIYLIDQKVYFIPDENVLISKNYDEKIKLLSTATECLSTLISRQGQIIPREELMDSIWKKRGVIASDNNFYQTILTIRKAFSTLGLDDVIATRYRRGLVIEKKTSIILKTQLSSGSVETRTLPLEGTIDEVACQDTQQDTIESPTNNPPQSKRRGFYAILLLTLTLGCMTGLILNINSGRFFDTFHHMNSGYPCDIYLSNNTNSVESVTSFLKSKKFSCNKGEKVYYASRQQIGYRAIITCDSTFQEGGECSTEFYLD
ncbi:winged helix-turn-helix domain-containing protein [Serratia fonticola]|uniref:winged helix-turn-helix domain-containing protein n=1 Tax=Serratia fonticola TaxID=47917 RepID=UPI003AFFCFFD